MNATMPPWSNRDPDFAALLNPFFVGGLLRDGAAAYSGKNGVQGLPFTLTFVLAPMVLHPGIRGNLPKTARKRFSRWVRENPVIRAQLASTSQTLVPAVREGISALMRSGLLEVRDGRIVSIGEIPTEAEVALTEIASYRERAAFCARWLASSGEPSSIFETIGIRP